LNFVRALVGDVPASSLGQVNSHDHLFLSTPALPGAELNQLHFAHEELLAARLCGLSSIVQWTPAGMSRHLDQLRAASLTTGVNVIAATGRHRSAHYGSDEATVSVEALAERFLRDISERRCGFIKVGVDLRARDAFEQTSIHAAAIAASETTVPIAVHLEDGTGGRALVEQFAELGVSPQRIVLGHVARHDSPAHLLDTAKSGAFMCLDVPRQRAQTETFKRSLGTLLDSGASDQILFGTDTTTRDARGRSHQARASLMEFTSAVGTPVVVANASRAWALSTSVD
jgi:predicted metal-dependent phosphotriesterase family hydrolase